MQQDCGCKDAFIPTFLGLYPKGIPKHAQDVRRVMRAVASFRRMGEERQGKGFVRGKGCCKSGG